MTTYRHHQKYANTTTIHPGQKSRSKNALGLSNQKTKCHAQSLWNLSSFLDAILEAEAIAEARVCPTIGSIAAIIGSTTLLRLRGRGARRKGGSDGTAFSNEEDRASWYAGLVGAIVAVVIYPSLACQMEAD